MKSRELYYTHGIHNDFTISLIPFIALGFGVESRGKYHVWTLVFLCFGFEYEVKKAKYREVPNV